MNSGFAKKGILAVVCLLVSAGFGLSVWERYQGRLASGKRTVNNRAIPVETAPIVRGPIALRRTFSGELEALAAFVVAPKVGGRVERVLVNIADVVSRGQVVANLDDGEYVQAVARARADLEEARAKKIEAESALEIAQREFERTASLLQREIASDSEFDAANQIQMAKQAQLKVAVAQVARAASSLEIAKIQLGYTKVTAGWSGGDEHRIVAERFVDEGQTVAANSPLMSIVEIDPIVGIVFVTEIDYAHIKRGQTVTLATDAYPRQQFTGRIDRVAPIFKKATRQARVEMTIDNQQHHLKPGMFIRATVVLSTEADAIIVPEQALTRRKDRSGVFVVGKDGKTVSWHEVQVGIREGGQVQVKGEDLTGRVVTLGLQQVEDGSRIAVQDETSPGTDNRGGSVQ
jgi:RND family efflux transporter MFP subunit